MRSLSIALYLIWIWCVLRLFRSLYIITLCLWFTSVCLSILCHYSSLCFGHFRTNRIICWVCFITILWPTFLQLLSNQVAHTHTHILTIAICRINFGVLAVFLRSLKKKSFPLQLFRKYCAKPSSTPWNSQFSHSHIFIRTKTLFCLIVNRAKCIWSIVGLWNFNIENVCYRLSSTDPWTYFILFIFDMFRIYWINVSVEKILNRKWITDADTILHSNHGFNSWTSKPRKK